MRTGLLTIVVITALTGIIVTGQQRNPTPPREAFDVVSIRRNTATARGAGRGQAGAVGGTRNDPCTTGADPRIDPTLFGTSNSTVIQIIGWAYGMDCIPLRGLDLVSAGPDWIKTDGYDITATRPEGPNDFTTRREGPGGTILRLMPGPKIQSMLQTMLAERFNLRMRRETRETDVYVLSVAPGGPKHTASRPKTKEPTIVNGVVIPTRNDPGSGSVIPEFSIWKEGDNPCCNSGGLTEIDGRKKTMNDLAMSLSANWIMGRPVLNRTALIGDFNYYIEFAPMDPNTRPSPEGPYPTIPILKALEQIGLQLKPSKEKVEIWVIDRVDRPSEN